jgi:hypothetical protein
MDHEVHLIAVETERTLRLDDLGSLSPLGVEIARYHTVRLSGDPSDRRGSVFLEFDGLIAPSARFACANLVIFTERSTGLALKKSQAIAWENLRQRRLRP